MESHSDSDNLRNPGFCGPDFIFIPDADQLHGVQEVVEGVGAVPELVLLPETRGYREEEKFIQVRGFGGQEAGRASGRAEKTERTRPSPVSESTCPEMIRSKDAPEKASSFLIRKEYDFFIDFQLDRFGDLAHGDLHKKLPFEMTAWERMAYNHMCPGNEPGKEQREDESDGKREEMRSG